MCSLQQTVKEQSRFVFSIMHIFNMDSNLNEQRKNIIDFCGEVGKKSVSFMSFVIYGHCFQTKVHCFSCRRKWELLLPLAYSYLSSFALRSACTDIVSEAKVKRFACHSKALHGFKFDAGKCFLFIVTLLHCYTLLSLIQVQSLFINAIFALLLVIICLLAFTITVGPAPWTYHITIL